MEKIQFHENSEHRINFCLKDYSNDFMAIELTFFGSKIEGVRKLFKNKHLILTIEEYLEKHKDEERKTLSLEDQKNPIFIKKAKELNKLANKMNAEGENIDEKTILEIINDVEKIIYDK